MCSFIGTDQLLIVAHLAYAFALKNKRMGERKAGSMQHCVMLCAPSDAAVDATLCELCASRCVSLV